MSFFDRSPLIKFGLHTNISIGTCVFIYLSDKLIKLECDEIKEHRLIRPQLTKVDLNRGSLLMKYNLCIPNQT